MIKRKSILKKTLLAAAVFSSAVLLYACSCNCGLPPETDVPAKILNKTNNFIIARTGKDFFDKYIKPDFRRTKHDSSGYHMVYRLIMPDKPYVNEVIQFSTDDNGRILRNREITGIPDCTGSPSGCSFNIDEKQARQIAEDYGLSKGIKNWKIGFMWSSKFNKYVWHVLSTESEGRGTNGFRGSGEDITIDPNNGSVLDFSKWQVN